jgi:hypothetical protein
MFVDVIFVFLSVYRKMKQDHNKMVMSQSRKKSIGALRTKANPSGIPSIADPLASQGGSPA